MSRSRFALCALFLLASVAVHADSISVFQITSASIFLFPESGGMAFAFTGPGIAISGVGSFDCPSGWCIDHFVAEGTPIDFGNFFPADGTLIQIDGKTYNGLQDNLNPWTMNPLTALFVPDGGSLAILNGNGLIPGSVITANGTLQFQIKVPVGALNLFWIQTVENPPYYTLPIGDFLAATSPVPEPSSVVLLVTGLAGILSTVKFRERIIAPVKWKPTHPKSMIAKVVQRLAFSNNSVNAIFEVTRRSPKLARFLRLFASQ